MKVCGKGEEMENNCWIMLCHTPLDFFIFAENYSE